MNPKIDELGLSTRTTRCLKSAGMCNEGDLVRRTKNELANIPGLGPVSLTELKKAGYAKESRGGEWFAGWYFIPPTRDDTHVVNLDLSIRARNILRENDVMWLSELVRLTKRDLRAMEGAGVRTANEIEEAVKNAGYLLDRNQPRP